ncbi:ceramidase domain-containing protein [Jiella sp. MQZ9-1]|uniref:Ceramidase domain-containing protein n=1 Tax=Jiella flava TaxID=2816857 RepID=A0A939FVJ4_9HYPH|nr:ceramidase domain-containing protein [Jiella flava]MBO0662292.1 ceramidase domain-containing protein [Jiella flava]MCD2470877.1 ceramidase domain-containing protein [Jiella flava]
MSWSAPIDAYCERLGPGFWAEPLNAISNLAFLLAALFALSLWKMRGGSDRPAQALCILVAVIGAGSFLFHTIATRWASLCDVIPIAIFIAAYFALALVRFFGLTPLVAGLGTLIFLLASAFAGPLLAPAVGSSASYVPALLAMLVIGGLRIRQRTGPGTLVMAAGITFGVSLTLRTLDTPLCALWPFGTHLFWHLLNAVTLGLLLVAAIDTPPARAPVSRSVTG